MALVPTYLCDRKQSGTRPCGALANHMCALCEGHFCADHAVNSIILFIGVGAAVMRPAEPFKGKPGVVTGSVGDVSTVGNEGVRIESRLCTTCADHVRFAAIRPTQMQLAQTFTPVHAEFVKQCAAAIAAAMLAK